MEVKLSTMDAWEWETTAPWIGLNQQTTQTQCCTTETQTKSSDPLTPQQETSQHQPLKRMHNRKRTSTTSQSKCNSKALEARALT